MTQNSQLPPQMNTPHQSASQSRINTPQLIVDTHQFIKDTVLQPFAWPAFEDVVERQRAHVGSVSHWG
jgi:hypothetical protein